MFTKKDVSELMKTNPEIIETYGRGRVESNARKKIECKETKTGFFVLLK